MSVLMAGRQYDLTKIVPADYVNDDEFMDYFRSNMRAEIVRTIEGSFGQYFPRAMMHIRRWSEHEQPWSNPPAAPSLEIHLCVVVEDFDVVGL